MTKCVHFFQTKWDSGDTWHDEKVLTLNREPIKKIIIFNLMIRKEKS